MMRSERSASQRIVSTAAIVMSVLRSAPCRMTANSASD
jgi:hypothetical protein